MNYLNDGIAFGVSSLGCPLIAINLDENPISGDTPDYIKKFIFEILGIDINQGITTQLDINQIDEIIKKHIKILTKDDGDIEDLQIYLSYLTSIIHEIRHYHDQISTSTGLDYLYYSLSQYINTPAIFLSIIELFNKKNIEYITLPFNYKSVPKDKISEIRFNEFVYYFERSVKLDANTKTKWNLKLPKLTSATHETLFETSAITSQLGFAYEIMGQKGCDLVMNLLKSTQKGDKYIDGIRILQEFKVGNSNSFGIQSAHINLLSWYALSGLKPINSHFLEAPSSIILWEFLLYQYSKSELNNLTTAQLLTFCENATNEWNFLDYKTSFNEWNEVMNERIKNIERKINEINLDYLPTHKLGVVELQKIMNDRMKISELQNKNLDLYFDTQAYGWGVLCNVFPRPTIALNYNNNVTFLSPSNKEFDISSELFFWEIVHNLLIYGRSNTGPLFLENYIFKLIYKAHNVKFWMN